MTQRLTTAQALVRFLMAQHTERDGETRPFFAGCFGIFGHGNVGGLAQALHQYRHEFRYILGRNEQAMVHASAGFARMSNRLRAFACATSIGPGATNLVTGETDPQVHVPRFFWWDVAVAEVSESEAVRAARGTYEKERAKARRHL